LLHICRRGCIRQVTHIHSPISVDRGAAWLRYD
jgi:hypothetical protein